MPSGVRVMGGLRKGARQAVKVAVHRPRSLPGQARQGGLPSAAARLDQATADLSAEEHADHLPKARLIGGPGTAASGSVVPVGVARGTREIAAVGDGFSAQRVLVQMVLRDGVAGLGALVGLVDTRAASTCAMDSQDSTRAGTRSSLRWRMRPCPKHGAVAVWSSIAVRDHPHGTYRYRYSHADRVSDKRARAKHRDDPRGPGDPGGGHRGRDEPGLEIGCGSGGPRGCREAPGGLAGHQ